MKSLGKGLALWIGLVFVFASCTTDSELTKKIDFDQQAMLTQYADGLIIPGYETFSSKASALETAASAFVSNPTAGNLELAQSRFAQAYMAWQAVAPFELGPAMEDLLRNRINTFPTDVAQIKANFSQSSVDLTNAVNADAQGLPAVDYLLYGVGATEADIISFYQQNPGAGDYLKLLCQTISDLSAGVYQAWVGNGGNYRATFIAATGTDIGSATGQLVNQLNYFYDLRIKTGKIGIPAGLKSNGMVLPDRSEAYYSGLSTELAIKALEVSKAIFLGQSYADQTNGKGLDDYLDALGAEENSQPLSKEVVANLDVATAATQDITMPIADAVQQDLSTVTNAHAKIATAVALLKTSVPSALGVLITFQDNDGD